MDNITNLPSCKECNRILKNRDINERGLCPKCLAIKIAQVENGKVDTIAEYEVSEQVMVSEQVDTTEYTESTEQIEAQNDSQVIDATTDKQPKIKAGQAIRDKFMELVAEGKITEEYIFELSTKEGTAKLFGVRYPFLLEYDGTKTVKEQTYINGHSRYTSKPVNMGDRQYLITNDIYAKTVSKFMVWADSLDK